MVEVLTILKEENRIEIPFNINKNCITCAVLTHNTLLNDVSMAAILDFAAH